MKLVEFRDAENDGRMVAINPLTIHSVRPNSQNESMAYITRSDVKGTLINFHGSYVIASENYEEVCRRIEAAR